MTFNIFTKVYSWMLEAATPLPTISAVLGHADPDSTRVYMATHRGGMLACVLPVPEGGSS